MRFKKHIRHPFTDTPRKRAAVLRRQQRERDAFPLFAAEIAAGQHDVDQVMSDRERHWLIAEIKARSERAAHWLEVRASIADLPDRERRLFLAFWNAHRWFPGDPSYCATVLRCYRRGDYVEQAGKLVSRHEAEYQAGLELQAREASDRELEQIIQSHPNMKLVEAARAERNRRLA
ncbi:hypothetical protein [uncultured Sphingopyxis sp.]|jgi:hypothetical protein|uniref:hypothetical protein n=1 Tax=uncultured Sphingopyxis sp. TaxID=310581 RepID=UPI0025951463|nr:hypothetical protein [uncultured Sphingopyxis sp.]